MSFAAAMLGAAGANRRHHKPGKFDIFRFHFDAILVIENPTLNPYSKMSGQLAMDLDWPVCHHALRIQLEAQCALKYQTKLDGRISFHKKYDNLLEGASKSENCFAYIQSPVYVDIFPERGEEEEQYELPAGSNRYRFNLQTTGEFLPAPFKTAYGSLQYKLVVYLLHRSLWVEVGEKVLQFNGYHNLSQNIDSLKKKQPVQVERSIKKSVFSSKRMLTATMELEEGSGYLPNEEIPFTLNISNPKCLPVYVWMKLVQRVTYNIDGATKGTVAVLGSASNEILDGKEYSWKGTVKVHKAASVSYSIHQMYKVTHELQFKIKLEDYGCVKGGAPIYIGSTREPVEVLMAAAAAAAESNSAARTAQASNLQVWNSSRLPLRRGSTSSIYSDCSSVLSHFTLPPAYSQLSSRVASLETLPPPYAFDDDVESIRSFSSSIGKGKGQRNNFCRLEFRVDPPPEDQDDDEDGSENSSPQSNGEGNKTPASAATSPTENGATTVVNGTKNNKATSPGDDDADDD